MGVVVRHAPVGDGEFEICATVDSTRAETIRMACTLLSDRHRFVVDREGRRKELKRLTAYSLEVPAGERTFRVKASLTGPDGLVKVNVRVTSQEEPANTWCTPTAIRK
jgi:hypothetical protein